MKNKIDIFVPLDFQTKEQAYEFLNQVNPNDCMIKIGLEMYLKFGAEWVSDIQKLGYSIFLDLKLYDIPNTVKGAITSVTNLGVEYTTLHASGGKRMMQAARQAADEIPKNKRPKLLAVTILTSFAEDDLKNMFGDDINLEQLTLNLAVLAKQSGMDGVVCSPLEIKKIRALCGEDFLIVTPGIRFNEDNKDDQSRVATPQQARQNGADYLVIGRSITKANNPKQALQKAMFQDK